MSLTFKLDRKAVDIGPEHIDHFIRFVDVVENENDLDPICCAVCLTCGNPEDPDTGRLVSVIEDQAAAAEIRRQVGELSRVTIEEMTNGK